MTRIRRAAGCAAGCLMAMVAGAATGAAQWPQFRGPNGSGVAETGVGYPVSFSPGRDAIWKVAVPYGQSSPVVVDGRVYITASAGGRLETISLDAATGRELWRQTIEAPTRETYKANDPASPTPAADRDGVVVFFADVGLVAYAVDGTERWRVPLGPFSSFYGMAASPIISDGLVVMLCDQRTGSFLLAVDRATGAPRWKTARPLAPEGWATPMVFTPADGPAQVVVPGSTRIDAYTLATGESRWWMPLGSSGSMGTVVGGGDTLFLSTTGSTQPSLPTFDSYLTKYDRNKDGRLSLEEFQADPMGEHFGWADADTDHVVTAEEWQTVRNLGLGEFGAIAVRPGRASGQLPSDAVVWRFPKNLPYIPAPLLYRDVLYLVKTGGIVTTLDPATGAPLKEGRAPDAPGEYYASPVAADGKVYLASVDGQVTVLEAGRQWQVLGVNDLGEPVHATPALAGGRLYVRTRQAIYCFGTR